MNPDKVWRGLGLIVAVLLVAATLGMNPTASRTILRWVVGFAERDVPTISSSELKDLLASTTRHKPVLLDTRASQEYAVSHLPHAVFAPYPDPDLSPYSGLAKDTPIVVYCSVGIRSGNAARRLRAAGFTDVRNLEGGIFEWVAESGPIVGDSVAPARVHPYNRFWALFLDKEFRASMS